MFRPRLVSLWLIVLLILSTPLIAQEKEGDQEGSRSYIKADTSIQASLSVKNQFLAVGASAVYRFGFLGLGAGVKSYFGLSLPENRIAPYARLELGRFYLGGGPAFAAPRATTDQGYVEVGDSMLLTAGFAPTFVQLGPGRLGLDASVDFLPTSHEVIQVEVSDEQGFLAYILASIIANVAANAAVFVVNTTKISLGATYSISF
jgi:hypothetical protein